MQKECCFSTLNITRGKGGWDGRWEFMQSSRLGSEFSRATHWSTAPESPTLPGPQKGPLRQLTTIPHVNLSNGLPWLVHSEEKTTLNLGVGVGMRGVSLEGLDLCCPSWLLSVMCSYEHLKYEPQSEKCCNIKWTPDFKNCTKIRRQKSLLIFILIRC